MCDGCRSELALIKTPICYRCQRLSAGFMVCSTCRHVSSLKRLAVAGYWQDPLKSLVHSFKYRHLRVLTDELGGLLLGAYNLVDASEVDIVVVPVPLYMTRQWSRGFNQSMLLAQFVARRLGNPLISALRRTRNTMPQFNLTREKRRGNGEGAFDVLPIAASIIRDRTVLLVDDVITTGSTMEACAKVLREKGAKEVWGLVLAKA